MTLLADFTAIVRKWLIIYAIVAIGSALSFLVLFVTLTVVPDVLSLIYILIPMGIIFYQIASRQSSIRKFFKLKENNDRDSRSFHTGQRLKVAFRVSLACVLALLLTYVAVRYFEPPPATTISR